MCLCPCGSLQEYLTCCGKYHRGEALPPTPEALMRSRYTAYTRAEIHYIKETMKGESLIGFNEKEAKRWAASVQWMGLKIREAYLQKENDSIGFVEFIVTFLEKDIVKTMHENSQFQCINGQWFYIGSWQNNPKIQPLKASLNGPWVISPFLTEAKSRGLGH